MRKHKEQCIWHSEIGYSWSKLTFESFLLHLPLRKKSSFMTKDVYDPLKELWQISNVILKVHICEKGTNQ